MVDLSRYDGSRPEPPYAVHVDRVDDAEQRRVALLEAVERAARRLIREGLKSTQHGLVVIERKDKTDPHYELCTAIEAIDALDA